MLKIGNLPKLSNDEAQALYKLGLRVDVTKVFRKSEREFDIEIEGEAPSVLKGKRHEMFPFTAWLPLYSIRECLNWTREEIAWMTDYPKMVMAGDWSGVRDSSHEKIWAIFQRHGKDALLFGLGGPLNSRE